ncbi:MAG: Gfo/Idh/MocA family oxidoreductase [Clostridiaceae bacterium]|jgi:predicted dehydrogenase|nr:Gfo/Idh/MocA family oxidoreductase [Clostridiaceae bacterium]
MVTIATIGAGGRGELYMTFVRMFRGRSAKITALCDIAEQTLSDMGKKFGIPENMRFNSTEKFFAAGKLADALIIGTQDDSHVEIATAAIEAGYDILLEKPISGNFEECVKLAALAKERGVRVVVCHVLRYSGYYKAIKNTIRDGVIGKVISVNHTENIGYYHYAHSYVRGDWRNEAASTPALLAKCCHDIDLIQWFMDKPAVSVSSLGRLNYFVRENAPAGATPYCMDGCTAKSGCIYDAEYHYLTVPARKAKWIKYRTRKFTGKKDCTKEEVREAIAHGPYGRCVYMCDNDVCDNQTVSIDFGDGQTAQHLMTAFSAECFRQSHIVGTKGELIGYNNELKLILFGQKPKKLVSKFTHLPGHTAGDIKTVTAFIDLLEGKLTDSEDVTFIEASLESHRIIMAAEQSRKLDGELIKLEADSLR